MVETTGGLSAVETSTPMTLLSTLTSSCALIFPTIHVKFKDVHRWLTTYDNYGDSLLAKNY